MHKKNQNFLETVVQKKKEDLKEQKQGYSLFRNVIERGSRNGIAIIAEIKFATPTHPNLGSPSKLLDRARAYKKAGVDAISIITEKHFFKGDIGFVSRVKKVVKLPILQKDFVIDEYQIYEAKIAGADALLFIARLVPEIRLKKFVLLAKDLGLEPVVEIQDEQDLKKAVATATHFIAVNARDLQDTFEVDVAKACKLMRKIPNRFTRLGFSGIHSIVEVQNYANAGAKGILIGTSLMKAKNINDFLGGLR